MRLDKLLWSSERLCSWLYCMIHIMEQGSCRRSCCWIQWFDSSVHVVREKRCWWWRRTSRWLMETIMEMMGKTWVVIKAFSKEFIEHEVIIGLNAHRWSLVRYGDMRTPVTERIRHIMTFIVMLFHWAWASLRCSCLGRTCSTWWTWKHQPNGGGMEAAPLAWAEAVLWSWTSDLQPQEGGQGY